MAKRPANLTEGGPPSSGVLPARGLRLWASLSQLPAVRSFYLAGGTGLALHLGHRQSDDLDFFSARFFRPELLARSLTAVAAPQHLSFGEGSVECWMARFKVQFLHYPYRLLRPIHKTNYGRLADPLDIALMKLIAISQRGSKRDFVDLACFLRQFPNVPLGELVGLLRRKYGNVNRAHILRALTYFADAESEPMPRMRWSTQWDELERQLQEGVRDVIK
jgi:nucleotidyltransferase AbiEii toxin of type IV toxin-antitoxin system